MMTFNEVVTSLQKKKRQMSLLIGNGFSMAYDRDIFSYNALYTFLNSQNDLALAADKRSKVGRKVSFVSDFYPIIEVF